MPVTYGTPLPPDASDAATKGELRIRVDKLILDENAINSHADVFMAAMQHPHNVSAPMMRSPNKFTIPVDHCAVAPLFWGEQRPSVHITPSTPGENRGSYTLVHPIKVDATSFDAYLQQMSTSPHRGVQLEVFVPSSYSGRAALPVGKAIINLEELTPRQSVNGWFTVGTPIMLSSRSSGDGGDATTTATTTTHHRPTILPVGRVKLNITVVFFSRPERAARAGQHHHQNSAEKNKGTRTNSSGSAKDPSTVLAGAGGPDPSLESQAEGTAAAGRAGWSSTNKAGVSNEQVVASTSAVASASPPLGPSAMDRPSSTAGKGTTTGDYGLTGGLLPSSWAVTADGTSMVPAHTESMTNRGEDRPHEASWNHSSAVGVGLGGAEGPAANSKSDACGGGGGGPTASRMVRHPKTTPPGVETPGREEEGSRSMGMGGGAMPPVGTSSLLDHILERGQALQQRMAEAIATPPGEVVVAPQGGAMSSVLEQVNTDSTAQRLSRVGLSLGGRAGHAYSAALLEDEIALLGATAPDKLNTLIRAGSDARSRRRPLTTAEGGDALLSSNGNHPNHDDDDDDDQSTLYTSADSEDERFTVQLRKDVQQRAERSAAEPRRLNASVAEQLDEDCSADAAAAREAGPSFSFCATAQQQQQRSAAAAAPPLTAANVDEPPHEDRDPVPLFDKDLETPSAAGSPPPPLRPVEPPIRSPPIVSAADPRGSPPSAMTLVSLIFSDISFASTNATADLQEMRISVSLSRDVSTTLPHTGPFSSYVHPVPLAQQRICLSFAVSAFSEERSKLVVEMFKVRSRPVLPPGAALLPPDPQLPREIVSETPLGLCIVGLYKQERDLAVTDPVYNALNAHAHMVLELQALPSGASKAAKERSRYPQAPQRSNGATPGSSSQVKGTQSRAQYRYDEPQGNGVAADRDTDTDEDGGDAREGGGALGRYSHRHHWRTTRRIDPRAMPPPPQRSSSCSSSCSSPGGALHAPRTLRPGSREPGGGNRLTSAGLSCGSIDEAGGIAGTEPVPSTSHSQPPQSPSQSQQRQAMRSASLQFISALKGSREASRADAAFSPVEEIDRNGMSTTAPSTATIARRRRSESRHAISGFSQDGVGGGTPRIPEAEENDAAAAARPAAPGEAGSGAEAAFWPSSRLPGRYRLHIAIMSAKQVPQVAVVGREDSSGRATLATASVTAGEHLEAGSRTVLQPPPAAAGSMVLFDSQRNRFLPPNLFIVVEEIFSGVDGQHAASTGAVPNWMVEAATGGLFDRTDVVAGSSNPAFQYECVISMPQESVALTHSPAPCLNAGDHLLASGQRAAKESGGARVLSPPAPEQAAVRKKPCLRELQLTLWHRVGENDTAHRPRQEGQTEEDYFWSNAAYIGECRVDLRPLKHLASLQGYYRATATGAPPLQELPKLPTLSSCCVGYLHLAVSLLPPDAKAWHAAQQQQQQQPYDPSQSWPQSGGQLFYQDAPGSPSPRVTTLAEEKEDGDTGGTCDGSVH